MVMNKERDNMQSFIHYLTEAKNTHLEHVEDLLFSEGIPGARRIFDYLMDVRDMLAGHSDSRTKLSVKWDGAPSFVMGIDPADKKFFVAKKGVFNKVPVVYKTHSDIDRMVEGRLNGIFHLALDVLKPIAPQDGAVQGDLLFTKDTLKEITIGGETFIAFHPNTLVYAIPINSPLAAKIMAADIGLVWHTQYKGQDLKTLNATYNANITSLLGTSHRVFQVDAVYRDLSGYATMTSEMTAACSAALSTAGKILNQIPSAALRALGQNVKTVAFIARYNNQQVRSGEWLKNPTELARGLLNAAVAEGHDVAATIANIGLNTFILCYQFLSWITNAKLILIRQLDLTANTKTFYQTSRGYEVANPEGYVAVDRIGKAVKLVDRLEFSRSNFSPDIVKGWR